MLQGVCFGENNYGQCGANATTNPLLGPVDTIPFFNAISNPVKQVIALYDATCVLSDVNGTVTCWGSGGFATLGRGDTASPTSLTVAKPIVFDQPTTTITVTMISGVTAHVCALFSNERAKCWGANSRGQLGQGHTRSIGSAASDMTSLPFISFFDSTAKIGQISAGFYHTCALFSRPMGMIICWGSGDYGALGNGSIRSSGSSPSDMTSLPYINFASRDVATLISVGQYYTCALFEAGTSGGRIRCWGRGFEGQLGTDPPWPTINIGANPTDMSSLGYISFSDSIPAISVSAGESHTCAAFTNERTRCWGSGNYGELGRDSTTSAGDISGTMLSLNYIQLLSSALDSVTPSSGATPGGDTITIVGPNFFTPTVTIQFSNSTVGGCPSNSVSVSGVVPVNLTTITFQTPTWTSCGPSIAIMVVILHGPSFNLTTIPRPFYFYSPGFFW
jgi:alpha-tubulin suppressor-like RCC1 family protein